MARGKLTEEVNQKAVEVLGREITRAELRLMPYVQHIMMNEQRLDPSKVNQKEREILSDWRLNNWVEGGASGMSVSKDFWDAMSEILFIAYVDYAS